MEDFNSLSNIKEKYHKLKQEYNKNGYFFLKEFIQKDYVLNIIKEIDNSKDVVRYYDKSNNLRRIEKIYNKGNYLNNLNEKILKLLNLIFDKNFLIFKDKFNSKPPGGEGFFAHYDGIFEFKDSNNKKKRGWYEYGDFFINVLVAIDPCDKQNGALELAKSHKGNFAKLLNNTKKDGSPALLQAVENKTSFEIIDLDIGDILIFSNTCPHRSKKNNSRNSRRIIYYTYLNNKDGSKYEQYFNDKDNSKSKSKALSER